MPPSGLVSPSTCHVISSGVGYDSEDSTYRVAIARKSREFHFHGITQINSAEKDNVLVGTDMVISGINVSF